MKFSLYIHWPFCIKKCPYCDFNSYAFKEYDQQEWVKALIKEIEIYAKIFPMHEVKTIFFGGGTPSLIQPQFIKEIINAVYIAWPNSSANIETTIEVNPSSIETHNLEEFMKSGINRFSIGIQSFNDDDLKFLGRLHSAQEAKNILKHAAKICNNVSADFIYTLPYDTLSKWKKDLTNIINFIITNNIKHVSLYQLTIEDNTKFFQDVHEKKWVPMNQDNQSKLYRYTHKIFQQLHWNQYEISNMSKHEEYECNHNLTYWNYEEYLGIGPGAHSRMNLEDGKYSFNNYKAPYKWKDLVEKSNINEHLFIQDKCKLDDKEQVIEKLLMGLRLSNGINLTTNDMKFINTQNLELLIQKNFIKSTESQIRLSLNGKLKLNKILEMLIN